MRRNRGKKSRSEPEKKGLASVQEPLFKGKKKKARRTADAAVKGGGSKLGLGAGDPPTLSTGGGGPRFDKKQIKKKNGNPWRKSRNRWGEGTSSKGGCFAHFGKKGVQGRGCAEKGCNGAKGVPLVSPRS